MRKNLPVTNNEITYPSHYRILSTTNPKGQITQMNADFLEVAGFDEEELLNKQHNRVRHPDMPPAAFESLWSTAKAGNDWMGIVKNRCKNGDHYWVDAFVTPIMQNNEVTEIQSVRTKPKAEYVDRAEAVYKNLNEGKDFKASPLAKISLPQRIWATSTLAWLPCLFAIFTQASGSVVGGLAIFALIASFIAMQLGSARHNQVIKKANALYKNPLMRYVYTGKHDDIAQIELALKMQESKLDAVVSRLKASGQIIMKVSEQVSDGAKNVNDVAIKQQEEVTLIATAINEMASTAQEVANSSMNATASLGEAQSHVENGNDQVGRASQAFAELQNTLEHASKEVQELDQQSSEIGSVITVITEIAGQTNLLALNAAIEAARAGEQGRGFAVVADEVRALASRTQESTEQIQSIIEKLQQGTKSVVKSMHEGEERIKDSVETINLANESLSGINQATASIHDITCQITAAVEEQAKVSDELNKNIVSISEMADCVSETADTSSKASEEMQQQLHDQQGLMDRFSG